MNDRLYLDIETIPAQRPDILEEIRQDCAAELEAALEAICHPANYKDPAKIAEWNATVRLEKVQALKDSHESKVDECYRKTALDGAFGQVCVFGWAWNDQPALSLADMTEEALLLAAMRGLRAAPSRLFDCTVIGHNVAGFDLRFLVQRCIVRGVRPHPILARAASAKPWEGEKVFDTMVQWAGAGRTVSLDKLCRALDIPSPKQAMDGSKVWDYVQAGRLEEVADYCRQDVEAVRKVHQRMVFAGALDVVGVADLQAA